MKLLKKWWFWVLVVIIVAGAISTTTKPKKVGENSTTAKTTSNETKHSGKKENNEQKEQGPQIFKIGDIVSIKDFNVAVNKIYIVQPNEFIKPDDGKEFLAIDITIENTSNAEKTVSSMIMFKVVDKDGRACEYSLTGQSIAKAGQLDGTVGVGRKMTGVYVVEVPKGQTGLELEFQPSFISNGQMVVKLN